MLYGAALDSIAAARRRLRDGDIRARAGAINKAIADCEWSCSMCLNHEAGGALSRNLAGLYAYIVRLLIESNTTADRGASGRSGRPAVHARGGLEGLHSLTAPEQCFHLPSIRRDDSIQ